MGNVNYKPMEPVSGWVEYPLETKMLEPPAIRVRLRPLDRYDITDNTVEEGALRAGRGIVLSAVQAVVDWDLSENGQPLACNEANKVRYLRPILGEPVAGTEGRELLGIRIVRDAQDRELFLKN